MQDNQNLLLDIEEALAKPPASIGQRLLNFIIDTIAYYILCYGAATFVIAFYLISNAAALGRNTIQQRTEYQGATVQIVLLLGFIVTILLYYILFEKFTNGRSVGKYVTGTKVVSNDGNRLSWKQVLLRSLIRFIPFEPLSAFTGSPWHDQWTQTRVIKIK